MGHETHRGRTSIGAMCVAVGATAALAAATPATAAPVVHKGPDYSIYGRTITSWSVPFVTWLFERSALDQKIFQITECQKGQRGKVFFLPTAFGGVRRLSCTVPAGTPVFASPAGYVAIDEGSDGLDLRHRDEFFDVRFSVDGTGVTFAKRDWLRKGGFPLREPGKSKRGVGTFAGYHVIVTGLEPGVHRIVQFARARNDEGSTFGARMTIRLTVTR